MIKGEELTIEQFDALVNSKEFTKGPFIESFGDGYGEPYNPNRKVFGTLKDGREVFAVKKPK